MTWSNFRRWMLLLLTVHLVVPSGRYFPSPPNLVLQWFAFEWYESKWVDFLPYALVGVPAFIFIGLVALLPFALIVVLLPTSATRRKRRDQAIVCLALAILLSAIYLSGWFFYTWPAPYQPLQTVSIILVTILAYKNWLDTANRI